MIKCGKFKCRRHLLHPGFHQVKTNEDDADSEYKFAPVIYFFSRLTEIPNKPADTANAYATLLISILNPTTSVSSYLTWCPGWIPVLMPMHFPSG
jgi:hypothetical protein